MSGTIWFDDGELAALRLRARAGSGRRIAAGMARDARAWATRPTRTVGIPVIAEDPDYRNLYDRFYAMMSDAAILEHLAFSAVLLGRCDWADVAGARLVALADVWACERHRLPDHGSAYATTRLLRAAGIALDLLRPRLDPTARRQALDFTAGLAETLWDGWFRLPERTTAPPMHHAHVEWSAFGIAALALRPETRVADRWIDAATVRFDRDLLPHGLAPDGAHVEGASFWASTMLSRLAFLRPLARVAGVDLIAGHRLRFDPLPALAAFGGAAYHGPDHESRELLLEPAYAQLRYHAPALLGISGVRGDPFAREVALRARGLGTIHTPDSSLPSGERLRFALGPFELLWDDPDLAARAAVPPRRYAFAFPSVGTAYLRQGWHHDAIVVAVDAVGRVTVHGQGRVLCAERSPVRRIDRARSIVAGTAVHAWEPASAVLRIVAVEPEPGGGTVHARTEDGRGTLRVHVTPGETTIGRRIPADAIGDWTVWASPGLRVSAQGWHWPGGARVVVNAGTVTGLERHGHRDDRHLGYGRLTAARERDDARPLVTLRPDGTGLLRMTACASPRPRQAWYPQPDSNR